MPCGLAVAGPATLWRIGVTGGVDIGIDVGSVGLLAGIEELVSVGGLGTDGAVARKPPLGGGVHPRNRSISSSRVPRADMPRSSHGACSSALRLEDRPVSPWSLGASSPRACLMAAYSWAFVLNDGSVMSKPIACASTRSSARSMPLNGVGRSCRAAPAAPVVVPPCADVHERITAFITSASSATSRSSELSG